LAYISADWENLLAPISRPQKAGHYQLQLIIEANNDSTLVPGQQQKVVPQIPLRTSGNLVDRRPWTQAAISEFRLPCSEMIHIRRIGRMQSARCSRLTQ